MAKIRPGFFARLSFAMGLGLGLQEGLGGLLLFIAWLTSKGRHVRRAEAISIYRVGGAEDSLGPELCLLHNKRIIHHDERLRRNIGRGASPNG